MLHLNTIDDSVHKLLLELSSFNFLQQFALAGGTSLALQIGHRKSIDIDLFAFEDVNMHEVSLFLENSFKNITIRRTTSVFIFCSVNSIKCDFVKHSSHKLIKPIKTTEGVRMFSIEDIAAMKLNAICGRGSKKDFYDIYSLLKIFTLKELLNFYDYKFESDNSWMALRSMIYFEDADKQEEPQLVEKFPDWDAIKKSLLKAVTNFNPNA
ncbi:MAG: nucleotidyl transferase AbiEii/AbiGii toxin family protein [Bacteroidetes bacterium]|nr:nucleotidyl transferase AbiEii/AbiGii toxin family protein [Bacteroidota bacterium]